MHNINPYEVLEAGIIQAEVDDEQIQQVGIDMRVRAIIEIDGSGVHYTADVAVKELLLKRGYAYELILDKVSMPRDKWGYIWGRSSFNRSGVFIRSSIIDPGYVGEVGVTAYCFANKLLLIGDRVGQLVVFPASPAKIYKGQYQHEKRRK